MAFTDDAVLAKLSALNETQDSIAATAQWFMFHKRHATQAVSLWINKLKDLPSIKRLNMIYLANEVTQQSLSRRKDEFPQAFTPHIADATVISYKGASADIQRKVRKSVDVWRDRNVFPRDVIDGIYTRLDEIDRSRSAVGGFTGSIFGSGSSAPARSATPVPPEISILVPLQQTLSKAAGLMKGSVGTAYSEHDKILGSSAGQTAPAPVFAARLNGLLRTLTTAEGAVTECIKARRELVTSLEKLLTSNREALEGDEARLREISQRKVAVEAKKADVEREIIKGMPSASGGGASGFSAPISHPTRENVVSPASAASSTTPVATLAEPERPPVEALTPPHAGPTEDDDDAHPGAGPANNGFTNDQDADDFYDNSPGLPPPRDVGHGQPAQAFNGSSAPGIEILSHLASQYQAVPLHSAPGPSAATAVTTTTFGPSSAKKRKLNRESEDNIPDLGIDTDVS